MRTLFIDLDPQWRGGQNQGLFFLRGAHARGHEPELVAPAGSPFAERARRESFEVHIVPSVGARFRAAGVLRPLLRQRRYAVVHANEAHALTAAWLARAHRQAPLVVSRRVTFPLGRNPLSLRRYRAAQCVLAISRFVASRCIDSGLDPDRVRLIHEGVEIPPLPSPEQRRQARARWGVAEDENLLGFVGYFVERKGQETLLRALPEVLAEFPRTRLLLAGDGPRRAEFERLRDTLGLGSAVLLPGVVEEITEVYRALDVFLFPAVGEGLGTSLLAALAHHLPAVAARSGACPEIVEDNVSGFLRPPDNPSAWADAIRRLLSDPATAARLGAAGRETIAQRFSVDAMVEQTLAVYLELAGAKVGA